jgi:hypothetical protein
MSPSELGLMMQIRAGSSRAIRLDEWAVKRELPLPDWTFSKDCIGFQRGDRAIFGGENSGLLLVFSAVILFKPSVDRWQWRLDSGPWQKRTIL